MRTRTRPPLTPDFGARASDFGVCQYGTTEVTAAVPRSTLASTVGAVLVGFSVKLPVTSSPVVPSSAMPETVPVRVGKVSAPTANDEVAIDATLGRVMAPTVENVPAT